MSLSNNTKEAFIIAMANRPQANEVIDLLENLENSLGEGGDNAVTVGTAGADYDNFDDAIDYLRTLGGGTIMVITNMTITSTAIKDVSGIRFIGNLFYSGSVQINKTAASGYWYGTNVDFFNIWFYRIADAGANEIFRFTADYQQLRLRWCSTVGIGGASPVCYNCGSFEAHIDAEHSLIGTGGGANYIALSNYDNAILHLANKSDAYVTGNIDSIFYDASSSIEGSPIYSTPGNPIKEDIAVGVGYTAAVPASWNGGVTPTDVKDALDQVATGIFGGSSTPELNVIYISDEIGTDLVTADGSRGNPYKSLTYAMNQVVAPTTPVEAAVKQKYVVMKGQYTENFALKSFLDIAIILEYGVVINGDIQYESVRAFSESSHVSINGEINTNYRNGDLLTAIVNGKFHATREASESSNTNGIYSFSNFFMEGIEFHSNGLGGYFGQVQFIINHMDIEGGYIYVQPAAALPWLGGIIEANGSILKSTMCGSICVYGATNCRIGNMDKDTSPGGAVTNGCVHGTTSSSYPGIQGGSRFTGSSYKLGAGATSPRTGAAVAIRLDSAAYKLLDSKTPTLVGFSGASYILADNSEGVQYTATTPADWVAPPPTDVQSAIDRIAAMLAGMGGAIP